MDDIKIWFYVIVAVIYVLSRMRKKGQETVEFPEPSQNQNKPPEKQLTFEELLREITQAKQDQPKPMPVSPSKWEKELDYDDDIKEETPSREEAEVLEDTHYDYRKKDNIYQVYEEAKRQAFAHPSLEDNAELRETKVVFEKFKAFEAPKIRENPLVTELKTPEGLKKAFIASEIFRRKF